MSIILGSIFLLALCLFAFVYLTLRGMPSLSLKGQRQTLTLIVIAGVFGVASQIRALSVSLLDNGSGVSGFTLGNLLLQIPAALFLLLAAWSLLRSERGEISTLQRSASVDPLTSLHNQAQFRRAAARRILQSKEYSIPLSLGMLDIDDFETYKDSYGNEAGDTTIRTVADILKRSVRADDLVARYEGEEFIMLLNCKPDDASAVFERVRSNVESYSGASSPESQNGYRPVTVSVGMTIYSDSAGTRQIDAVEEIIERAGTALERARREGKNRVSYDPEVA